MSQQEKKASGSPPSEHRPDHEPEQRQGHAARDVRQGEIILRTRRRRIIFFGGLIGIVLLGLLLRVCAGTA